MHSSDVICPFCGKNPSPADPEDKKWFRQGVEYNNLEIAICSSCIVILSKAVTEDKGRMDKQRSQSQRKKSSVSDLSSFSPKDVFEHLNKDIIGQDDAKKTMAIAVYQHYARIKNPILTQKSNVLIVGPTGSGKTELARSIASFLKLPFVQVDTTTMTPRGYIGDSPEVCIEKLYYAANGNIEDTERGIIFLDEFDKVPSGVVHSSYKAKAVQQELLKIVEGTKVELKIGMEPQAQKVTIDTSNILFIAAGSFVGLEELVIKKSDSVMGIAPVSIKPIDKTPQELSQLVENKHFEEFGIIPEILGRFPVMCFTSALSKSDLVRILTEPQSSIIEHYKALFKASDSELVIDSSCLDFFAENAIKEKLGARGLKKQIERRLKPILFDIDKYKGMSVTVLLDTVLAAPVKPLVAPETEKAPEQDVVPF